MKLEDSITQEHVVSGIGSQCTAICTDTDKLASVAEDGDVGDDDCRIIIFKYHFLCKSTMTTDCSALLIVA